MAAPICYGKSIVHKFYSFCLWLMLCGLFTGVTRAETFHLTDGQTVTGEIVAMDEKGIILKLPDGQYADQMPWGKLSQADLKQLQENPKAAPLLEPFIELTQEDKLKRTEIEIKDVARLARPARQSLIAAMFSSGIGVFILLLVYAGNLYAAYEVSVFRARPVGLVCGLAAVAPVVAPIIFLSMPTHLKHQEAEWQPPAEDSVEAGIEAAAVAADQIAETGESGKPGLGLAPSAPAAAALPPTKTFLRGQFTFNRRFFETQMPTYFGVVRPEVEKDMVLSIKSARGSHVAQRITRISGNDIQFQVQKGQASEDVTIPFIEIHEVRLKHKDAQA